MIKRIVSTSFWTDSKVVDDFSPEDRYFMLYLLTNPHTTQLGVYELNLRTAAFELGYSVEAISVLLDRFESKYNIIKRSKSTNEIAILNYLQYAVMKGGKPVSDLLERETKRVKDKSLLIDVVKNLEKKSDLLPTILLYIDYIYNNYINNNNIYNDNDNESTQDVTSPVRSAVRGTVRKKVNFISPSFEEIEAYAKERGREDLTKRFFDYYTAGEWKDKDGKQVKNWKQRFITWENKNEKKQNNNDYIKSYDIDEITSEFYKRVGQNEL